MSQRETFIIPVAPARRHSEAGARRMPSESGIRLGILDNSKGNADYLLRMLVDGLRANFPVTSVVSLRKSSAADGAEPETLDRLAAEADVVLSAMAD